MKKIVVYAGSRNVYSRMMPAMKSLLQYVNVDKIYFLIEDDEFPYKLPEKVECINVSGQTWFTRKCPNWRPRWTYMILLRAVYTQIFPQYNIILSLDNDTIIQQDFSEIWDIDMTDYYIAGTRDTPKMNIDRLYINSGVVLFNLKKIREDKKDEEAVKLLKSHRYKYPEQDVFNEIFKDHIYELTTEYNSYHKFVNYNPENPKILHLISDGLFYYYPIFQAYKRMNIEDLRYK